jgi:conserved repeat domain
MPTVSGTLYFDIDRNMNPAGNVVGISNIPIVLQNVNTLEYLAVNTTATGTYSFINVPAGEYKIVEIYGFEDAVPSPGDFTTSIAGEIQSSLTPPIEDIPTAPPDATNVDCVTPSTIIITVASADITGQNFFNGPVKYTSLRLDIDACTFIFPINLLEDADFGTFGFFPEGTLANTGLPENPYPIISPDFTYVIPDPSEYTPIDGEFTLQNTMNNAMSNQIGAWWRISDHTTGNESGRMMVVNGFEGDEHAVIIREIVDVTPDTTYLFSAWIANLFRVGGFAPPQFGVSIYDQDGIPLYSSSLGFEIPESTVMPEWKEIGTVINTRNNTQITVEFLSEGEAAIGNDFAFDDIALRQVRIPQIIPVKTVDKGFANIGDTVTYTITVTNNCERPLMNVLIQDQVPISQEFITESITVNGIPYPDSNPYIGISIPQINGGEVITIQFQAKIIDFPNPNPAINSATIQYLYTPIEGGFADVYSNRSNNVNVFVTPIDTANLIISKTTRNRYVAPCEPVLYNITIGNIGTAIAQNVILTDVLPIELMNPVYSIDNGCTWQAWIRTYNLGNLLPNECRNILIKCCSAPHSTGCIYNTAYVSSDTPDSDLSDNQSTTAIKVKRRRRYC